MVRRGGKGSGGESTREVNKKGREGIRKGKIRSENRGRSVSQNKSVCFPLISPVGREGKKLRNLSSGPQKKRKSN